MSRTKPIRPRITHVLSIVLLASLGAEPALAQRKGAAKSSKQSSARGARKGLSKRAGRSQRRSDRSLRRGERRTRADLRRLTEAKNGRDPTQKKSYREIANWVARRLERSGVEPAGEGKGGLSRYRQRFQWDRRSWPGMPVEGRGESENVVGILPGDGSTNEAVLVIAHLDGLTAEQKQWEAKRQNEPSFDAYQGANDNASAVAAALQVADGLAKSGELKRDVIFLFPSAEEEGLKGTEAFLQNTKALKGKRIVGTVNFEMVGRGDPSQIRVFGGSSESEANRNPLYNLALGQPKRSGQADVVPGLPHDGGNKWFERSDHYLLAKDVPSIMYLGKADHYHTPRDNMKIVEPRTVHAVGRHALRVVRDLARDPQAKPAGKALPFVPGNPFSGKVYDGEGGGR